MTVRFAIVDAFTDDRRAGNPAAVCRLPSMASDEWMQSVAAEFALPMTAFIAPASAGGTYDLRWFTDRAEVELCGHATLAAAHLEAADVTFNTRAGPLRCRPLPSGEVEMDFPAIEVTPVEDVAAMATAAGCRASDVRRAFTNGHWSLLDLGDAAAVRAFEPDLDRLGAGGPVVVFAFHEEPEDGVDSVCRMFNPAVGLDEDAVTGSAHCILGPLLAAETGRCDFVGIQESRRGGRVGMAVRGGRVLLRGRASTFAEGTLRER